MSDRDRLLVAAAAIGLVACALIWGAIGVGVLAKREGPQDSASISQRSNSEQRYTEPNAAAIAAEVCAESRASSAEETDETRRSKGDLCAQFIAAAAADRSASYALPQTIIGAVGLTFILATFIANAIATFAATNQATTAREHLERMETPFLRAVPTPRPEPPNGWDWIADGTVCFENCGRSYAIITHSVVRIDPVWRIQERGWIDPLAVRGKDEGRGAIVSANGGFSLAFDPRTPRDSGTLDRMAGEGGYVHGLVRFEDPLGKRWVMGFAFLYIPFQGRYFVVAPGDGHAPDKSSGNYHRREETLPP